MEEMVVKHMTVFLSFASTSPSKDKASKKRSPRKPTPNTTTTTTPSTPTTKSTSAKVRRARTPFLIWEEKMILDGMATAARNNDRTPYATIVQSLKKVADNKRTNTDVNNWHRNYMHRVERAEAMELKQKEDEKRVIKN